MQCFWADFGKSGLGDLWSRLCEVHGFWIHGMLILFVISFYLLPIFTESRKLSNLKCGHSNVWPSGQKDNSLCTTFLGPIETVDQLVDIDLSVIVNLKL
jgi:hypothetical protein